MTVKKLIEQLQALPAEQKKLPICTWDSLSQYVCEVTEIEHDTSQLYESEANTTKKSNVIILS